MGLTKKITNNKLMSFEYQKQTGVNLEQERRVNFEKLRDLLKKIAEALNKEGLPVTEEARIDMKAFYRSRQNPNSPYQKEEVKKDETYVAEMERKFQEQRGRNYPAGQNKEGRGEKVEMLKTAVFHKMVGNQFAVMRSSRYDDIKNGVDNVVVDKETGGIICAFDEVADNTGSRFKEKEAAILDERNKNGASLKYGIIQKGEQIIESEIKNIPTLYLCLSPEDLDRGMEELIPELGQASEFEKKLFDYFVKTIEAQISALNLKGNLNPLIKKRLDEFVTSLDKMKGIAANNC
ncbi:MAG: hypothetical protein COY66_04165 [Candidatus Kerfeldbacteria bacterium CG_4_10_14_0_8_um_filter_42_10]|uniref:Uncharacterized protein n=1 Tax=Candidatus Kerfeldbacteria bacterium CG_4_10_14_0_8_um_filter_42_10 TaxID=2014248 RepID=A0A2M7RIM5_9BACT|nr:MAG: hypothetical protein COY66_04165 [Candidatus Kerfeldbacteria bacterium CG_4_10_14_0_8_um_filter_42_10]